MDREESASGSGARPAEPVNEAASFMSVCLRAAGPCCARRCAPEPDRPAGRLRRGLAPRPADARRRVRSTTPSSARRESRPGDCESGTGDRGAASPAAGRGMVLRTISPSPARGPLLISRMRSASRTASSTSCVIMNTRTSRRVARRRDASPPRSRQRAKSRSRRRRRSHRRCRVQSPCHPVPRQGGASPAHARRVSAARSGPKR